MNGEKNGVLVSHMMRNQHSIEKECSEAGEKWGAVNP